MKSSGQIMADAKTRYRHIYSDATIIGWFNIVLKELWKIVPRESFPATIALNGTQLYDLPNGIKRKHIKKVTKGVIGGTFTPLDFVEVNESSRANGYSLMANQIVIEEDPNNTIEYILMIYYQKTIPDEVTELNLSDPPDIDESYEELVTVALLERIASARKDIKMKNNYASDYQFLLGDFAMEALTEDPDYPSCRDELPRRSRYGISVED